MTVKGNFDKTWKDKVKHDPRDANEALRFILRAASAATLCATLMQQGFTSD